MKSKFQLDEHIVTLGLRKKFPTHTFSTGDAIYNSEYYLAHYKLWIDGKETNIELIDENGIFDLAGQGLTITYDSVYTREFIDGYSKKVETYLAL